MMYNRLSCMRCASCFVHADAEGDAAVRALHCAGDSSHSARPHDALRKGAITSDLFYVSYAAS